MGNSSHRDSGWATLVWSVRLALGATISIFSCRRAGPRNFSAGLLVFVPRADEPARSLRNAAFDRVAMRSLEQGQRPLRWALEGVDTVAPEALGLVDGVVCGGHQ